jgi:hypothetical protein
VCKLLKVLLPAMLMTQLLYGQIDLSGSVDFEFSYGGQNSSYVTNEIVQEFRRPHLGINQLNLFLFSDLGNDFFFSGRIQWDTWKTGQLNPARISLAFLSYEPLDSPLLFSIGRFTNPFGLYSRRQIASQNLFVNAPLIYGYYVNISDTRGFYGNLGQGYGSANTDNYDPGMTTIYYGGYTTGGMFSWVIVPETMDLSIAVSNVAPASERNYTNLQNLAVISRLGLQPLIYWQQGFSFSYGSFMHRYQATNYDFDKLERFKQMIAGTDFIFAYSYFELSGEFIYAKWNVPASNNEGLQSAASGLLEFDLTNYGGYIDLKYEPSFFTGSYIALRGEKMVFDRFDQPDADTYAPRNPWDDNLIRYSAAFGYKISHNILFKFAFSEQIYDDETIKLEDYTFRSILTVSL